MTAIRLALVLSLVACSSADGYLEARDSAPSTYGPQLDPGGLLRVDVYPGTPVDERGDLRALPQTLGPFQTEAADLDLGALALTAPGTLTGFVTAEAATPWAASAGLPVAPGPVPAEVRIRLADTVQQYTVRTGDDGVYEALLIPSGEQPYVVAVVPDDPGIPVSSRVFAFRSTDAASDFDLGPGVPLYGRVTTGTGDPVADARVAAVDAAGTESRQARTDSSGWYVLYVQPDADYTLVCTGRDHGRDPTLSALAVRAENAAGGRADFTYPTLVGGLTFGRVTDTRGGSVPGAVVRFRATALDGYEGLNAELVVEDTTDANGSFDAPLLAGTYDVEVLPPASDDPATDLGGTAFAIDGAGVNLGDVELPDLVAVRGAVLDPASEPIAEARITCGEIGLGGRSWSTFSDGRGAYELSLPPYPVRCTVQPPGSWAGALAWTRTTIDPALASAVDLPLRDGRRVLGHVSLGGVGEPYGVVEVRTPEGELLGSTVTTGAVEDGPQPGAFELRVDF